MITKVFFTKRYVLFLREIPLNYTQPTIFYPEFISYIERIESELNYNFVLVNNKICLGTEKIPRLFFSNLEWSILKPFECESISYIFSVYLASDKELNVPGIIVLPNCFLRKYDRCIILYPNVIVGKFICINLLNRMIPASKILYFSLKKIYNLLKFCSSECSYRRISKETEIQIFIKINSKGISYIYTGFGFFDHLIDQICIHANIDIGLIVKGDIYIDEHHSIEDAAIVIGITLLKALKDKRGILRYGFLLPMDDNLVQVAIDLGGRSSFTWKSIFKREKIGDVPTEMFLHFFKSFSDVTSCNLHIKAEGNNEHHKIEAIFKAFACALKMATRRNKHIDRLPSSKELL